MPDFCTEKVYTIARQCPHVLSRNTNVHAAHRILACSAALVAATHASAATLILDGFDYSNSAAAQAEWEEAFSALEDRDFDAAIPKFRKIFYAFGNSRTEQLRSMACLAAYNAACGYSLNGDKEKAVDWMHLCFSRGYLQMEDQDDGSKKAHIEKDTDLDNIRKHPRFLKLMKEYGGQ